MPFDKPWKDTPENGDLIYGVNSDLGRKWYIQYNKKFKGKVFTVDSLQVMKDETSKGSDEHFLKAISMHNKYKSALTQNSTNEAVRRKCKAGLDWAVSSGKTVHFVLDDLDLDAVVDKNWGGKNADKPKTSESPKNHSITGSELRWIYRNRFRLEVIRYIQFWIEGNPCPPPWVCNIVVQTFNGEKTYLSSVWNRYVPINLVGIGAKPSAAEEKKK